MKKTILTIISLLMISTSAFSGYIVHGKYNAFCETSDYLDQYAPKPSDQKIKSQLGCANGVKIISQGKDNCKPCTHKENAGKYKCQGYVEAVCK